MKDGLSSRLKKPALITTRLRFEILVGYANANETVRGLIQEYHLALSEIEEVLKQPTVDEQRIFIRGIVSTTKTTKIRTSIKTGPDQGSKPDIS